MTVQAALEDRMIAHNPVAKLPLPKIQRNETRFVAPGRRGSLAMRSTCAIGRLCSSEDSVVCGSSTSPAAIPRGSCSSHRRDCRSGRRCSGVASGLQPSRAPGWSRFASMIRDLLPSRSGSPADRTPKQVAVLDGHTSVSVVRDR